MAACRAGDTATYYDDSDPVADFIVRAGAWGVHASGSPTKVGEYQNLDSSPLFDAEGIWSDGDRTLDFSASESDNDTHDGRLHYFGPHSKPTWITSTSSTNWTPHDFAGFNYGGLNNTAGPAYPNVAD